MKLTARLFTLSLLLALLAAFPFLRGCAAGEKAAAPEAAPSASAAASTNPKAQANADATANPPALAPIVYQQETLGNGLRVIYAPLRQAPVVHVRVLYHVGSKDEKPDRQGFAHMFEHMMFRGSAHVPPERHMQLINSVGGISNAFTSFDQTTYVNTVPAEHTEMALWLEADRMASFKVTDAIYKIERKVVAQEWAMRMNQPYGNMYEEFLKNLYAKHSYRWTPIGNMEQLKAASSSELQDFFNTYYIPNNAVLVVAGDIDIAKTKQWVKSYFGWIPKGPTPPRLAPREPEQTQGRRAVVPASVPLPAVIVGVRVPPYKSDDNYALDLLEEILGGGRSSRLNERLVSGKNPLCTNAQAMHVQLEDGGIFGAMGMLLAGKNPDEVEKILREELLAISEKGITEEELAKAKTAARLSLVRGRKTAEDIARDLGEEWLFGGDPARANSELKKIEKLTAADVQAVARKYIEPQLLTTLQMVPDPTGQLAKKAMQEAKSTIEAPVAAAAVVVAPRLVTFPPGYLTQPPLSKATTAAHFNKGVEDRVDGVKVITMTDNRLPLATFSLTLRRGSYSEPADKVGLAGITAEMLRRGAGGIDYNQLNQTLDEKGISIGVSDEGDNTRLVVSCPSEQLDEAVKLARLVLQKPDFPQEQFDHLKAQSMSSLMRSLASPTTVTEIELDKLLYGNSPLGRSSTPKSLASITLDDVKAFYKNIYRPADAIFIAAGNVSEEKGKELAEKLVGDWGSAAPSELPPAPKYDLPPAPAKRTLILVDNPDARQAAIKMGIPAYTIASNEKYAGSLANQILSGGIESRVMKYVRAEKGLAYGASGVFMPARHAGIFQGQTATAIENSADAIEAMFKVFNDVRNSGVTPAEVTDAQLRVAGSLVMGMQTIDQQAQRRLEGILNGYPADYYDQYAQRVREVNAEQIQTIMSKYVKPDAMQIVVVAPADASKEKLSKLGEVKVIPMPGKGEEMLK